MLIGQRIQPDLLIWRQVLRGWIIQFLDVPYFLCLSHGCKKWNSVFIFEIEAFLPHFQFRLASWWNFALGELDDVSCASGLVALVAALGLFSHDRGGGDVYFSLVGLAVLVLLFSVLGILNFLQFMNPHWNFAAVVGRRQLGRHQRLGHFGTPSPADFGKFHASPAASNNWRSWYVTSLQSAVLEMSHIVVSGVVIVIGGVSPCVVIHRAHTVMLLAVKLFDIDVLAASFGSHRFFSERIMNAGFREIILWYDRFGCAQLLFTLLELGKPLEESWNPSEEETVSEMKHE